MESIENFIPDNNELSNYYRLKKEFPLFDEEILNVLTFEHLRNNEYYEQVISKRKLENEILKEQIENNKNKIIENGIEQYTPKDIILNKIDYTINDDITELLESFNSKVSIDNVSNEHEHKVTTS